MNSFDWQPWILTTNSTGNLIPEIEPKYIIRIGENTQKSPKLIGAYYDWKKQNNLYKKAKFLSQYAIKKVIEIININKQLWYKKIKIEIKNIDRLVNLKNIDIIIASYAPMDSLLTGAFFAEKYQIPLIIDLRDLGVLFDAKRTKFSKFLDYKLQYILKHSHGITTVSKTLKNILEKTYQKPTQVVFNGWDETKNKSTKEISPNLAGKKYLHYAGKFRSQRMEPIRKLLTVMKSNHALKDTILVIRSLGPVRLEQAVIKWSHELKVNERILLLPPCDIDELLPEEKNAFCNLVFEDLNTKEEWSKGTLTGKLLKMLTYTPPILAITRKDSDINEVLSKTEKGKVCSTEHDINAFFEELFKNTGSFTGNQNEINFYSNKKQTEILCDFFNNFTSR
jgi:hypothetical protein